MYACVLVLPASLSSHIRWSKAEAVYSPLPSPRARWAELGAVLALREGWRGGVVWYTGSICESSDSTAAWAWARLSLFPLYLDRTKLKNAGEFGSAQNGGTVCKGVHCFDKCNELGSIVSTVLGVFFSFCTGPGTSEGFCTAHIWEQWWILSLYQLPQFCSYFQSFRHTLFVQTKNKHEARHTKPTDTNQKNMKRTDKFMEMELTH
jgi:hypothetical protein